MSASARLAELGLDLPVVVKPLGSYVPAVSSGNLVYTSGQLPMQDGKLVNVEFETIPGVKDPWKELNPK